MKDKANIEGARRSARCILTAAKKAFTPEGGRATFENSAFGALTLSAFYPEDAAPIIAQAKAGDPLAIAAVEKAVAAFVAIDEPLPEPLKRFFFDSMVSGNKPKRKPGKSPQDHHARNQWIALAVRVAMSYGFDRTRNRAHKYPSACSIVQETLASLGVHMTERNVETITEDMPSQ